MRIVEEIPAALHAEIDAALAWINATQKRSFKVTGIIDPEIAERAGGAAHDLTLILCEGDVCVRERVRVRAVGGFEIAGVDGAREDPPAEIDPLPGARKGWLDRALAMHAFVVLVFYRGFW
ncbi:MAG: hypothetical protein HYR72_12780 [Deltaproteobacteria bacterium]|nr:hypothetical protein [Deltaproteobacteria bacterium]MBI3387897.1 hypothetical protein [Deltaproteobacteria bacterium]